MWKCVLWLESIPGWDLTSFLNFSSCFSSLALYKTCCLPAASLTCLPYRITALCSLATQMYLTSTKWAFLLKFQHKFSLQFLGTKEPNLFFSSNVHILTHRVYRHKCVLIKWILFLFHCVLTEWIQNRPSTTLASTLITCVSHVVHRAPPLSEDHSARLRIQAVHCQALPDGGPLANWHMSQWILPLRIIAYQLGVSFIHWHYKFNFYL